MIDYKRISDKIRNFRTDTGISQEELVYILQDKKAGVNRNTLSKLENGQRVKLSLESWQELCSLIGCDIGFLLGEHDCKTKDAQGISDVTGLPEEAVETLQNLEDDSGSFLLIEDLLSNPVLLKELGEQYLSHWIAVHVMAPIIKQNLEDLAHNENERAVFKKIQVEYSLNDLSLPKVPITELADYTRFQFERSVLHFVERDDIPSWVKRANKVLSHPEE